MEPFNVGLVGYPSAKLSRPAPARNLYTNGRFRSAVAHAEATCDRWFVLSAKHGLLEPDTVVDPYRMRLGVASRNPDEDPPHTWAWVARCLTQLDAALVDVDQPVHVTAWLSGQYRTLLFKMPHPFTDASVVLPAGQ